MLVNTPDEGGRSVTNRSSGFHSEGAAQEKSEM